MSAAGAQEGELGGVRWVIQELNKEMGHASKERADEEGKKRD